MAVDGRHNAGDAPVGIIGKAVDGLLAEIRDQVQRRLAAHPPRAENARSPLKPPEPDTDHGRLFARSTLVATRPPAPFWDVDLRPFYEVHAPKPPPEGGGGGPGKSPGEGGLGGGSGESSAGSRSA